MRSRSINFDEGLLQEGKVYAVGTNDGKEFRRVVYGGTRLMNGKPMMIFKTEDNLQLSVNPSFHTYTLEEIQTEEDQQKGG